MTESAILGTKFAVTGASRRDVLIAREDAQRLELRNGDRIRLRSAAGVCVGTTRIDQIKPGNLEVHWPEGNVLFSRELKGPDSHEPDYNAIADLEKVEPRN